MKMLTQVAVSIRLTSYPGHFTGFQPVLFTALCECLLLQWPEKYRKGNISACESPKCVIRRWRPEKGLSLMLKLLRDHLVRGDYSGDDKFDTPWF
jgi:hypothetical protein